MKKPAKRTAAKRMRVAATPAAKAKSAPQSDWRNDMIERIRTLIKQAAPEVVEEVKWRKPTNPAGVPTWSLGGIICTGETYKNYVKMTFAKGASLPDPAGLFNAGLDGNVRRAIDIREGDKLNEKALKALIREALVSTSSAGTHSHQPHGGKKQRKST